MKKKEEGIIEAFELWVVAVAKEMTGWRKGG